MYLEMSFKYYTFFREEKKKSSNKRREIRVPENPATDVGCDSTEVGLTEPP